MAMLPRQARALLDAVAALERELLCTSKEALVYDHQLHASLDGFSRAYAVRFGELAARRAPVLLLHAGASLTDKKDALGLPVQAVGVAGSRAVLLLRVIGPHRLVGAPGPALWHLQRVFERNRVGPLLVEPWPEPTSAPAA